jgi:methyl coenzyme M reductase gamma subunit
MTDNDVALEILETREKAMQMIDRIGVETIETDQATRGILVGTGGMVGHGLGVQSVGIGTATTETMTSIEDDSIHVLHARIWTMHR